jgi:hypothetical protein
MHQDGATIGYAASALLLTDSNVRSSFFVRPVSFFAFGALRPSLGLRSA